MKLFVWFCTKGSYLNVLFSKITCQGLFEVNRRLYLFFMAKYIKGELTGYWRCALSQSIS